MFFNHAFDIAFEVISAEENGEDVTGEMLRQGLERRLRLIPDDELVEACGAPFDSNEMSEGEKERWEGLGASDKAQSSAIELVKKLAALRIWGEPDDEGEPFEPVDGHEDSHECLMDLIEEARTIVGNTREAVEEGGGDAG